MCKTIQTYIEDQIKTHNLKKLYFINLDQFIKKKEKLIKQSKILFRTPLLKYNTFFLKCEKHENLKF